MKLFKIDKTDFALGNYLFGAVSLNKNADKDKFGYIGFGTDLTHACLSHCHILLDLVKMLLPLCCQ